MLKHVIESFELLSSPSITGDRVADMVGGRGATDVRVTTVEEKARTQFIRFTIPGTSGKTARTLGLVGNLGGLSGNPEIRGLVSDADGAVTALAVALRLLDLRAAGESLSGDVIVSTHICTSAPTIPHEPVPFMGNPTFKAITKTRNYVDPAMEAILHIETSRANRVVNARGFAITPTIKEGYILRVSNHLMDIYQNVTGQWPVIVPLGTIDLTPIDNGLYHLNGMAQENVVTDAPIVGVALTSAMPIAGSTSGASQIMDIEAAARFAMEVAKGYTAGRVDFYDASEFEKIIALYGSMKHLRKLPN
ncbi:MAG: DUF1177 family protein [Gammaproteobacteria bacterium]|nr:DUF1177 family protein [Gammaproteobacteria bacterium]